MTGFLGQKFDFTGVDGGWYCLIKDEDLQISMVRKGRPGRTHAPSPKEGDFPPASTLTSLPRARATQQRID